MVGVDSFLGRLYGSETKRENALELEGREGFTLVERDLRIDDLRGVFDGADAVVNEAAMPGLVLSWDDLELYVSCNLLAFDRAMRAAHDVGVARFVQISTSSVYGRFAIGDETRPTEPVSPYGVTKLAAEKLLLAHVAERGFPGLILRYFSVYGPRQRPDMAYHRFAEALLDGRPITVYGDGKQSRVNTYVDDCVDATLRAIERGRVGEVYNVAGGASIELLDAIAILADELGATPELVFEEARAGDQRETNGDIGKAKAELGYEPTVEPEAGLRRQAAWHRERQERRSAT